MKLPVIDRTARLFENILKSNIFASRDGDVKSHGVSSRIFREPRALSSRISGIACVSHNGVIRLLGRGEGAALAAIRVQERKPRRNCPQFFIQALDRIEVRARHRAYGTT
jgi:hypothetical protein